MREPGPGAPEPLGLTLVPGGANIAVFSAHATAIELCLFDDTGQTELERIALPSRTGDIWHAYVPGIVAGTRYGLRADGPWDPERGHRFDPTKLLVDPHAVLLDRQFKLAPAMFSVGENGNGRNMDDSAPFMPKAIAVSALEPDASRPRVPWGETIVYEMHVRGYTQRLEAVPPNLRGTCAGLAHPAAIEHLVRLGVTTVELMPLAAAVEERHLAALGLVNYWRYNPVAFCAPDPLLAPGGADEIVAMVAALHAAGIEVIVDVVFNHSGEGDALGPTLSLRGLDNATYYRLAPDVPGGYINDTGCGNTLALDRPPVLRLVLDAFRRFAAFGIDGFRLDLASTLGRRADGFDPAAPLLQAMAQDPLLRDLKIIAEPWDIGPGGYQLGAFPAPWGEWNDQYRDAVRRFWRGDSGLVGALATRVAGSADVFAGRSRPLSRSINFVTAHDGFTLADLVAHARKHNEANGEHNRDGTDANFSWNHGVEGLTTDPTIRAARDRDVRALLATLLLSRGTPMLAMGDELGRTQHGNNNAYSQDTELAWVDWATANQTLCNYTAGLIRLRREHPALRLETPLTGRPVDDNAIPDVEWRRPDGREMAQHDWSAGDNGTLIAVLYAPVSGKRHGDRVAIALNASREGLNVQWPEPREGMRWHVALDSAEPSGTPKTSGVSSAASSVGPRSVVVLTEEEDGSVVRPRRAGIDPAVLSRLAAAAGIAPSWQDVTGVHHEVGLATTHTLLTAMGLDVRTTAEAREHLVALADDRDRRLLPHTCVAHDGAGGSLPIVLPPTGPLARVTALRLTAEDGRQSHLPFDASRCPAVARSGADGRSFVQRTLALPPLPAGYYTLAFDEAPDCKCHLIVAPTRCYLPPEIAAGGRRFGVTAHVYSLRHPRDQGIGDFTALTELALATAAVGGATVGVNPLHAMFATNRERASPYHPSDRRFLDPLYIDLHQIPHLAKSSAARQLLGAQQEEIARLQAVPYVDYPGVWALKRAVLEATFATFRAGRGDKALAHEFDHFVEQGGDALQEFALFEAISSAHPGVEWMNWPVGLRGPKGDDIEAFAARHADAIRFAQYTQWLADRQLAAAATNARNGGLTLGFYRDLAVGAAPDGAEAWANTGSGLARGVSVGAPPDPLALSGQIWCLPPPIPGAMTASGYAGFRALLAANMRHAGALRIDHVMALARLFWIPDGAHANDGTYVTYPRDDLLAVLALESWRARCLVVGEDLGTVPGDFRERMAASDVLSYRVVYFEREGHGFKRPARYASKAAAVVSTHDLPTVAGWWAEEDIAENQALGRFDAASSARMRHERSVDRIALVAALEADGAAVQGAIDAKGAHTPEITAAVHRFAAATPSALVLIQADDLAGETVALNLPGTDRERPNWRRKLGVETGELWKTPVGQAAAKDFASRKS